MSARIRSAVAIGFLGLFTGLLSACTDQGTPEETESSTPSAPTTTESSTATAADGCPSGTYQVESLTAKESVTVSGQQLRVADVTGLTLEFRADGTWTLTGDGASITITAAGVTASATVDGTASGDYAKTGDNFAFTQKSADGKITLDQPAAGIDSIPMADFGPAIAPSGTAAIACTATGATITAENATLELSGGSGAGTATATASAPATGGEPAPSILNESGQTATYSCGAAPVTINGSNNTLTFTGSCDIVTVNGVDNTITATAKVVNLNGTGNHYTWTGAQPQVNDNGTDNIVTQG